MVDFCSKMGEALLKIGFSGTIQRHSSEEGIIDTGADMKEGACVLDYQIKDVRKGVEEVLRESEAGYEETAGNIVSSKGSMEIWISQGSDDGVIVEKPSIKVFGEIPFAFLPSDVHRWCEVKFNGFDKLRITDSHFHEAYTVGSTHIHFEAKIGNAIEEQDALMKDLNEFFTSVYNCQEKILTAYNDAKERAEHNP